MDTEFDIISRVFTKKTPDIDLKFKFKTKSLIFDGEYRKTCGETEIALLNYLQELMIDGKKSFEKNPSGMPLLILKQEPVHSYITKLAENACYDDTGKYQHSTVQNYFLNQDSMTVAVEVPVWSEKEGISGFIDIIRYVKERNIVQILDFKPKAHNEKKALTQLYYYKKLFMERTGIKENIDCIYFDKNYSYKLI